MTRLAAMLLATALPSLAVAGDPELGEALATRWCTTCHIIAADASGGDAGPAFPSLMRGGARSEGDLRRWLFEPHPPMPDLELSEPEIDALVAYILAVQD